MRRYFSTRQLLGFAAASALMAGTPLVYSQTPPAVRDVSVAADLKGRTVEGVRIVGNKAVLTATILNVVRTREGDKFDPATVQEDYQRVFGLRRFSNVEAKVEPTATGVVVIFEVSEQQQISDIRINFRRETDLIREDQIRAVIDIEIGQAIDQFRIAQARRKIEQFLHAKNYALATVTVDTQALNREGALVFEIVEGPYVRVRNITFKGNTTFSDYKLSDQIKTRTWIWLLRDGTFSTDQVDDDVAAVRKFYQEKGFFDVRVGRKLIVSPDQSEMQVDFVVEEGPRYTIEKVTFKGNSALTEATLRHDLKLVEGMPYDNELIERDTRKFVRDYSPLGFIYQPGSGDPNYLRIDAKPVFRLQPGSVELIYEIREGEAFTVRQILPRGNTRTQDKVILRELRLSPGDKYDSGKIQDAVERLRGTPLFQQVKITPIGDEPGQRDLLVEVEEARTATLTFGAGINSNGGLAGNITYTQKNFDITNWPRSLGDLRSDRSFVGAGQTLRISFEPGTTATNASIRFVEPWILDQPYSLTAEAYLRTRVREVYNDDRMGGRVSLGHRFDDHWSASIGFRLENVEINNIKDKPVRAFEILDEAGDHGLTSLSLSVRRDTTTGGVLPSKGTNTQASWESYGVFGGDYTFQRFSVSHDAYFTLYEDLVDRKTILTLSGTAGYISGNSPFFERFYGGGINSVRGFAFRGISPRSGPDDDRIGGDFIVTGTAEIGFPLVEELLRGVVFTDVGMVEPSFEWGTMRASVGAGVRITLPVLGQVPIAIDFAVPLNEDSKDDTQLVSFSLGFTP